MNPGFLSVRSRWMCSLSNGRKSERRSRICVGNRNCSLSGWTSPDGQCWVMEELNRGSHISASDLSADVMDNCGPAGTPPIQLPGDWEMKPDFRSKSQNSTGKPAIRIYGSDYCQRPDRCLARSSCGIRRRRTAGESLYRAGSLAVESGADRSTSRPLPSSRCTRPRRTRRDPPVIAHL